MLSDRRAAVARHCERTVSCQRCGASISDVASSNRSNTFPLAFTCRFEADVLQLWELDSRALQHAGVPFPSYDWDLNTQLILSVR